MFCTQCGQEVQSDAAACVHCGAKLNLENKSQPVAEKPISNEGTKFCTVCGKQISTSAVVCVHCGAATKNNQSKLDSSVADDGGIVWLLLGLFFPIVGLILYLIWKDDKPLNAKKAIKGAIWGFVISIVCSILYFILMIAFSFLPIFFIY